MRSVLAREIPEFASGQLTLTGCAIKRLRSAEPEGHWTATYLLTVVGGAFGAGQTVASHGVLTPPGASAPVAQPGLLPFGADGWSCFVPDLGLQLHMDGVETALPAVELLLDPTEAPALIQEALLTLNSDFDAAGLSEVETLVLEDKPGVRCTLRCRLHYVEPAPVDDGRPDLVIAKVHADDEGGHIHDVMQMLGGSTFGRSRHVDVAQPLGYLPGLRLLVQSVVPEERTLKDLVHVALQPGAPQAAIVELEEALRRTARGLADLHMSGVSQGSVVAFADELAILRTKQVKLAAVVPRLADVGASALDRLAQVDSEARPDPSVPVHHSFRPSQVLIAGDQMAFIDFDKFCRSEAASDLAMLTTKLRHVSMNKVRGQSADVGDGEQVAPLDAGERDTRVEAADRLCEIFVTEYAESAIVSRRRLALWEALEHYSLILSAAKKMNEDWIDSCAFMFDRHLRRHDL